MRELVFFLVGTQVELQLVCIGHFVFGKVR